MSDQGDDVNVGRLIGIGRGETSPYDISLPRVRRHLQSDHGDAPFGGRTRGNDRDLGNSQ